MDGKSFINTSPTQPVAGKNRLQKAQSFIELALVLPILLIMLLGMVEVVIFIGRYLDVLDLTREAARFASVRDPYTLAGLDTVSCSQPDPFHFYFHTSCIFSPPTGSPNCTDTDWCNGLNPYMVFDPETDDIVISVYTVMDHSVQDPVWPQPDGYWAYSDHDADLAHNSNFKRNCAGEPVRTQPYYTKDRIDLDMSLNSTNNKGFVAVEFYYCYSQVLGIPIMSDFLPNPIQIHAYTLMPLPAAQPSATPKP
ncbi:MAG: pilus assembly protein [Anaerolineae bacterium]|nr:pilus assembly protein [Anaerolineae bacterium]